jgi:hypothetical protein
MEREKIQLMKIKMSREIESREIQRVRSRTWKTIQMKVTQEVKSEKKT